jgi:transcription elongation GreA/GreB family factor
MTFKEKIYRHYLQVIDDKIHMLNQVLADLKEAGANETKSTAGDKHETALAMVQIEQANVRKQLHEVQEQKAILLKINPAIAAPVVVPGSLVKTNNGYLFMSTALGKATIDGNVVISLSPQSPLGKNLVGLRVGETAIVNTIEYVVQEIW